MGRAAGAGAGAGRATGASEVRHIYSIIYFSRAPSHPWEGTGGRPLIRRGRRARSCFMRGCMGGTKPKPRGRVIFRTGAGREGRCVGVRRAPAPRLGSCACAGCTPQRRAEGGESACASASACAAPCRETRLTRSRRTLSLACADHRRSQSQSMRGTSAKPTVPPAGPRGRRGTRRLSNLGTVTTCEAREDTQPKDHLGRHSRGGACRACARARRAAQSSCASRRASALAGERAHRAGSLRLPAAAVACVALTGAVACVLVATAGNGRALVRGSEREHWGVGPHTRSKIRATPSRRGPWVRAHAETCGCQRMSVATEAGEA